MDQKDKTPQNQINIELSEETADGIYSNLAIIQHSNQEFVVDFIKVMPGVPKAKVKARVVLTPQHTKRFMRALADNLRKFESMYGEIQEAEDIKMPMAFGGPTGQA
jgi:allophanate hydrolase subunit 1